MYRFGIFASQFLVQLPMLAVLLTGIILAVRRRPVVGSRRSSLALAGLGVLVLSTILSLAWSLSLPTVITQLDVRASEFGVVAAIVNFILGVLFAAGVGLLVAAALSRGTTPTGGHTGQQSRFTPPGHQQPGHQPGFPPPGYSQPGFSPSGHPQPGPQPDFPASGHSQPGPQSDFPASGHSQPGPQSDFPASGHPQSGPQPGPQSGFPPSGYQQTGYEQTGADRPTGADVSHLPGDQPTSVHPQQSDSIQQPDQYQQDSRRQDPSQQPDAPQTPHGHPSTSQQSDAPQQPGGSQ